MSGGRRVSGGVGGGGRSEWQPPKLVVAVAVRATRRSRFTSFRVREVGREIECPLEARFAGVLVSSLFRVAAQGGGGHFSTETEI